MVKILYVEDNEDNLYMLSNRLKRRGYEVVSARDGEQGIAMAASEAPALILMDLSLPVMDGWEATRRLKAEPRTQNIPVIALSAHAMAAPPASRKDCGPPWPLESQGTPPLKDRQIGVHKVLVWDAATRLFHWLTVALVIACYVSWRMNWMDWHSWTGEAWCASRT